MSIPATIMSIPAMRSVLTGSVTRQIHFRLPGIPGQIASGPRARQWTVNNGPTDLSTIAPLLVAPADWRPGKIAVEINPALGDNAMYRIRSNTMVVSHPDFPRTVPEEAMLVHEAVHIHHDRRGIPLPWDSSEMMAYVAQCLYLRYRNPIVYCPMAAVRDARLDRAGVDVGLEAVREMMGLRSAFPGASNLLLGRRAAAVAASIEQRQTPTADQMLDLRHAVRQHPNYIGLEIDYVTGDAVDRQYNGI